MEIKITIVTTNEKTSAIWDGEKGQSVIVTHDSSTTIMSSLLRCGLISGSICGGRGDCGRCRVQFIQGATMPTALERSALTAEELRQGYRLACLSRPKDDCVIRLAVEKEKNIEIISDMMAVPHFNDYNSQHNTNTLNRTLDVFYMDTAKPYEDSDKEFRMPISVEMKKTTDVIETIIAVDLGTTTIAMQLMEDGCGRVVDTYCEMNPQRCYGSDVLSRIKASCEGERGKMQQMVLKVLEKGVEQFRRKKTCIRGMCIAGNTTMEHLLMGFDVLSLGRSPFMPVEIGLQEYINADWDFKVWITPGISAFVGGDIVAGLYALDMLPGSSSDFYAGDRQGDESGVKILIDLGTNGEMAITDDTDMIVTATAAGPAFEGGAGAGIIGSDMIAVTANLLQRGILDETGLLAEPYFSEGISVGEPPIYLCNKDIRDLQMAKAAVRSGVEILWKKMGQPKLGQVYLAGGFGYYLDVEAAFRIGLLPEFMRDRVIAAGNTSLAGAYRIGCDLLHGKTGKKDMEERLSSIKSINLAEQEEFQQLYMQYINLNN